MSPPWSAWRPQLPSAEFAGRAVAAILRDRARRRATLLRRARTMLALAAVLATGAAWAWTGGPRSTPPRAPDSPAPSAHVEPSPGGGGLGIHLALPRPDVSTAASASHVPPPARHLAPPGSASTPAVKLPRCNCPDDWYCDCVETQ